MIRTGWAALAPALLLLFTGTAVGTTVVPLTFDQLTGRAVTIVHARVAHTSSTYGVHLDRPAITTTIELKEPHALKGERTERFTVFGGTVGGHTMTLVGQPELKPGEEVFLFLTDAPVQCPYIGIWQGVFHVREGQVFRGKRPVVDVVGGKLVLGKDNERGMRASAFAQEIQRVVKASARRETQRAKEEK